MRHENSLFLKTLLLFKILILINYIYIYIYIYLIIYCKYITEIIWENYLQKNITVNFSYIK